MGQNRASVRLGILSSAILLLCGCVMSVASSCVAGRMTLEDKRTVSFEHAVEGSEPDRSKKDEPPPQQLQDFSARCSGEGVLVCEGFDSPEAFRRAKWPARGLYPAWDAEFRGTFDTTIQASGRGSLRFEIPSHSAANAAGFWRQPFEHNFGQGSTFYVQFRQRFSKEMLDNNWVDTTWKQAIFHNESSTCGEVELTTVQYYHNGFPYMYTDCGARILATNNAEPPTRLQQGDYNCWYGQYNAKSCFLYPANQWITFYYKVSIGHWGKPDSHISAWVALDGQTYKQWIDIPKFILKNDHPGNDYDTVTLLTYMTNKSMTLSQPVAYAWYDDLIVSMKPIAPPTRSGPAEPVSVAPK
jgi:hypothetical protein